MTKEQLHQLGTILWSIANELRGAMNADDFRDYMLSFLFLRYLSNNYERVAKEALDSDYPESKDGKLALTILYENKDASFIANFEDEMKKRIHYVITPEFLWNNIVRKAKNKSNEKSKDDVLITTLQNGFDYIESTSFDYNFKGLFSEVNLTSQKLGKTPKERDDKLCTIIQTISGISQFSTDTDILGDAYEYLISQFAAGSGKKAGEFYTPQPVSTILSGIVTLDSQDPTKGKKKQIRKVLDFACGSGSLLLNIRKGLVDAGGEIGRIFGQEKNITTYNLARMNMLLHGVKNNEFEIHHGDTLKNDWDIFNELNPRKKMEFDVVVANPPFSYRWEAKTDEPDSRFKSYGIAPKSAADFAFLLHGFHFLSDDGVMAIILPHGVLFRKGVEERIRTKLLKDGNIDTVIGLPSKLFFSTDISVCILVLKRCKKSDDVLFINASEQFQKGRRLNQLLPEHIHKIVNAYQFRKEENDYSSKVSIEEIKRNDYNLSVSRYVSTVKDEEKVDLQEVNNNLLDLENKIYNSMLRHNKFLIELGLSPLPLIGEKRS